MRLALDVASALVIAAVAVLAAMTFRDYGITWDETWHLVYGDYILDWFASAGRDRSALSYRADYLYGGGFDLLGALVRRVKPPTMNDWEAIHLLGAMVGVLGLVGTWRLARQLGGPAAGLAATVMLATTPVYYGHIFNNPKDVPFAVGYVWAIHALCIVAAKVPRVPRRDWVVFSVAAGLAMSVRIGGLLVLCYLVALIAGFSLARIRLTGRIKPGVALFLGLGRPTLLVIAGAWVVMLASWPWALLDPLRRPLMALGRMTRFTIHERKMPFAGQEIMTTDPRWDYLLHYFGLKTPVLVLVLVAIGVVLAGLFLRKHGVWEVLLRGRCRPLAILALAIVMPPLYAIVGRSILYDGLRHFLFLVPLLCVVAGVAAVALPAAIGGRRAVSTAIVALGIAGLSAQTALTMRQLHPHQYVFFNRLAGGLPGAFLNYDTDYYGNSYKEGFALLDEHLWRTEPEVYLNKTYTLSGCIPDFIAHEYMTAGFRWKDREKWRRERWMKKARPDFYLGYTRANCHNRFKNDPVLLQVERQDTLLNVVRDRRLVDTKHKIDAGITPVGLGEKKDRGPRPLRGKHRSRRRGATWDKPDDRPDDRPDDQPDEQKGGTQ
ncbi:MAG: glycosyltransferase family 39 protein [Nannocystaceae bacterium]|nr:glycosyltransferase family 39 protein [Nannocystaceae bacterium]